MKHSKNIQKMFRNLWYGSISIILALDSTLGWKFHTYTKNSLHLTRIGHQLNKRSEIQIVNNLSHIITRIQFLVQLAAWNIIHHAQGLTFERLAFDLVGVTKHGLTYTTLSQIHSKENLYLLSPLLINFFQIDLLIKQEMYRLQTTTQYELTLPSFKSYHEEFIVIQPLNTCSLKLNFRDVLADPNILSHFFAWMKQE
jgi:hypothetical protein